MQLQIRITIICLLLALLTGCANNTGRNGRHNATRPPADDDAMADSTTGYVNCNEDFFRPLPRFKDSTSAHLILEDKKKVTLTWFFKDEFMSPQSQYGLKDLDGDGSTELVIYNNTGGAHCCDELYIFHATSAGQFRFAAHVLGGSACISAANNTITYSLNETLGYFFGCYACTFQSRSPAFKPMRDLQLRYTNGRLHIIDYAADDENQNIANLRILQQHGYEKIQGLMDNGWRKEFAMNLAVWHYNHGKNWSATKKLFNKYYTFKDAARIWKEFYATLIDCAKENTF